MDEFNRDRWKAIETSSIYLPNEILAYHLYLLEFAIKNKNAKEEKREKKTILYLKRKMEKEETECLKM